MKLTLMALGGYKYYLDEKNTSTTPHFMNFTLPSPDSFHPTPRSSSSSSTGSGSGGSSSSTVTAEYEMTVICINFLHVEEVVNLWLDSVKILSDLSQLRPLEVSKNSLFCLKVSAPLLSCYL